ncbi:site-specific integrase [Bernardetia sp. ABR2-2B]|uniref:tyrosine-type recombinase/integrase n=1 Tax=Bernardetia sp. ABR2-2B TaxID=3127472 RepID=UPI0030CF187C
MDENENKKFPYKLAKLVEGKRKYIEYWLWSIEKNKLVRIRITQKDKVNELEVIKLNKKIEKGNIYLLSNSELAQKEREKNKTNILAVDALELALENSKTRMRGKSTNSYKTHVTLFCKFLNDNFEGIELRNLDTTIMEQFLNFYQKEKNWSAKTRNTYSQNISTLVTDLKKLGYIRENPFVGFATQKVKNSSSHRAYNAQQRQILKEKISIENPQLWLMCCFLFYTFARPNEVRQLKISYIELENNKIFIPAHIAKNGKDGRVDMPVQLRQLLIDSKIFDYPSNLYILGKEGNPSNECHARYSFSKKYKIIKDSLGFESAFTLYSWKHTGVSEAYKNGVDILEISQQCRHWDLNETRTYLRSLGVYSSEKIKNNFPTL